MFPKASFGVTLMLVLAACSSSTASESVDTTTTQAATTSTTRVATTTTTLDTDADVQALDPVGRILPGQRLSVGDYTTTLMTPTIRFSISEFWDFRGEFASLLLLGQPARQQALNFILFPAYSGEAVVEVIQSEAIFEASEVVPAKVGGIDGVSFVVDVVVPGGGSAETTLFPNNQTYSQVDLDPPSFNDGEQVRVIVLEIGDNVLAIMAGSGPFGFNDFLETADELLATITFG